MPIKNLHVYLNFGGNTEEAFNFYRSVFGGEFSGAVVRFKDMPMEGVKIPKGDENKIMHMGLKVGETWLMGTDTLESLGHKLVQGNNVHILIEPDSKDEADRIFNMLSAGGKTGMRIADQPWGDYYGSLTDKYGVNWMINYAYPQK